MDIELKHYLDEQFKTLATKDDIQAVKSYVDKQTTELKLYADEQTEKLARIIATTIAEPMERNFSELKDYKSVQEEVSELKADMRKIKASLQLN